MLSYVYVGGLRAGPAGGDGVRALARHDELAGPPRAPAAESERRGRAQVSRANRNGTHVVSGPGLRCDAQGIFPRELPREDLHRAHEGDVDEVGRLNLP